MSLVEEVKKRLDIVEIAGGYTQLSKAGKTYRGLCPLHSEKHGSFFVYPEDQSWHCFGACNTGGDIFSLVMKKEGLSFAEALRMLAEKAGVEIPDKISTPEEEREPLYRINLEAAYYFHNLLLKSPLSSEARRFLEERGVLPETTAKFQLGYSLPEWGALKNYLSTRGLSEEEMISSGLVIRSDSGGSYDRFRDRLIFPIRDIRGRVTGFGGRALDDTIPKYLNSGATAVFNKSEALYGIDLAKEAIRKENRVIIVEGYMDAIIAHQFGFTYTVASMGTAITEDQISQIKKLTRNVILALDSDQAGEEAMLKCVSYENILANELKIIVLPQDKDPDDAIRDGVWPKILSQAIPLLDYAFEKKSTGVDLGTAQGKSEVVERLMPFVAAVKDPVRQAHYLVKLARLADVSEKRLELVLRKYRVTESGKSPPTLPHLFDSPLEEYCLSLLIRHPELREETGELVPEFFDSSQNREVFLAIMEKSDISEARERLDPLLRSHFDYLATRAVPEEAVTTRLADSILRLKERYIRRMISRRKAVIEARAGLPEEIDTDLCREFREVFQSREREIKRDRRL